MSEKNQKASAKLSGLDLVAMMIAAKNRPSDWKAVCDSDLTAEKTWFDRYRGKKDFNLAIFTIWLAQEHWLIGSEPEGSLFPCFDEHTSPSFTFTEAAIMETSQHYLTRSEYARWEKWGSPKSDSLYTGYSVGWGKGIEYAQFLESAFLHFNLPIVIEEINSSKNVKEVVFFMNVEALIQQLSHSRYYDCYADAIFGRQSGNILKSFESEIELCDGLDTFEDYSPAVVEVTASGHPAPVPIEMPTTTEHCIAESTPVVPTKRTLADRDLMELCYPASTSTHYHYYSEQADPKPKRQKQSRIWCQIM